MSLKTTVFSLLAAAFILQCSATGIACPGCEEVLSPHDEELKNMVEKAFTLLNTNSDRPAYINNIVHVTKQVVNGMLYKFDINMVYDNANCMDRCHMYLLLQPWKYSEPHIVSQNCTNSRIEKQLFGGLKDIDQSEMDMVKELAEYAVKTLDDIDIDSNHQRVAKINKAKKQLVNGIMYYLDIEVHTTSCPEGKKIEATDPCLNREVGRPKNCKVQIHRSWADNSPLNAKVVNSECEEQHYDIVGGITPMNSNDDSVNKIAQFAVKNINARSNSLYVVGLVGIQKAATQVVAGIKYYLTLEVADTECTKNTDYENKDCKVPSKNLKDTLLCEVQVWEKSWENFMEVTSSKCTPSIKPAEKKHSVPMPGGPIDLDTAEPYVKELAGFALSEMDKQTNSDYKLGVKTIIRATSQVVSGVKITLTMGVGMTQCQKNTQTNSECVPNEASKTCTIVIWDRPWLNDRRVIKSTCEKMRSKRETLAGGITPVDVNSPAIKNLAEGFAIRELSSRLNAANPLKVVRILSASSQVVAGTLTRLTLEVSSSNCGNNCNAEDKQICDVAILEQPWRHITELTSFKCRRASEEHPRVVVNKRDLGGHREVDVNDPIVEQASTFALSELNKASNSDIQLGKHTIIRATSQLVKGKKVTLEMLVGECSKNGNSNCVVDKPSQTCTFEVLIQAWLNKTELLKSACKTNESKKKRSPDEEGYVTGLADEVDPKSQNVVKMIKYFLKEMDKKTHSEFRLGVDSIHSAVLRVVAGEKLVVRMSIGESDCRKSDSADKECTVQRPSQICNVTLMDWTWMDKMEILNSHCENIRSREERSLAGGETEADVNSVGIADLKEFISQEITARANSLHTKSVIRIVKATTQIVSGTVKQLTVEVGDTNCLKTENKAPSECSPLSQKEEDHQLCEVVIWEQPWLNKRELQKFECHNARQPEPGLYFKEAQAIRRKRDTNDLLSWENMKEVAGNDYKLYENFISFVNTFQKVYTNKNEISKRFRIFRANMMKIDYLQRTEQGTATYGPTMFADLTRKEFKERHLGLNPDLASKVNLPMAKTPNISIPVEFDWRQQNVVTPVKNQGMCGSCWAFSVTGNIEGLYAIKNKQLVSLSEQELVDCDKYDSGCKGGLFNTAYEAIEDLGGLELESDYPYEGFDEQCFFNKSEVKVSISGGLNISKDENDMAKWLVANGPFSVALNANAMQFYLGGVSHPLRFLCSPKNLDHGVLIVGYGVHRSWRGRMLPFWIVKNSWGKFWGKKGYYLVYRGDGTCGINQMPSTATLQD